MRLGEPRLRTGGKEGKGREAERQAEEGEKEKGSQGLGPEHCWCRDKPQTEEVDASNEARKIVQMLMSLKG